MLGYDTPLNASMVFRVEESKLATSIGEEAVGELKNRNIDLRQKLRMLLNKVRTQIETITTLREEKGEMQLR